MHQDTTYSTRSEAAMYRQLRHEVLLCRSKNMSMRQCEADKHKELSEKVADLAEDIGIVVGSRHIDPPAYDYYSCIESDKKTTSSTHPHLIESDKKTTSSTHPHLKKKAYPSGKRGHTVCSCHIF